jgi:subtilisin family serine protease
MVTMATLAPAAGAELAFEVRDHDTEANLAVVARLSNMNTPLEARKIWVFFTDKSVFDSETCAARVSDFESTLSEHAAKRRAKTMQSARGDFHDLDLHAPYVESLRALGLDVKRESRWLNAVSVIGSPVELEAAARLPFVSRLAPVLRYRTNKPERSEGAPSIVARRAGDLFNYGASRDQLEEINVLAAHDAGYSGAGVIVALLDTGFDKRHPVFATIQSEGRLLAEYDFIQDDGDVVNDGTPEDEDQHNHGTFTWSALGGFEDGFHVGPAYGASFVLGKTEQVYSEHSGEEDDWVTALEWADENGADVVSTSLGWNEWYTWDDLDGDTAPSSIATDLATGRGIVMVNSAGNEGNNDWYYVNVPADADLVISVGAVDNSNSVAGFSSHGPTIDGQMKPEVVARGVDTHCAGPLEWGGGYFGLNGTSLSCPLVAGAAALLIEANPSASALLIRNALMQSADNATTPDNDRGWGRIDVMAAIDYMAAVSTPDMDVVSTPRLAPRRNPTTSSVHLDYAVPARVRGDIHADVFTADGSRVRRIALSGRSGSFEWDGRTEGGQSAAPGIYLVRLAAGDWQVATKVVFR